MARKSKSVAEKVDLTRKKKKDFDIDTNIRVAYKTGKIIYGRNQVLKQTKPTTLNVWFEGHLTYQHFHFLHQ